MITMLYSFVPATGAMHMCPARMNWFALIWVFITVLNYMLIAVITVRVVKPTIYQIVYVTIVSHSSVTARWAMDVAIVFMGVATFHLEVTFL